jgi:hypothetical protein
MTAYAGGTIAARAAKAAAVATRADLIMAFSFDFDAGWIADVDEGNLSPSRFPGTSWPGLFASPVSQMFR